MAPGDGMIAPRLALLALLGVAPAHPTRAEDAARPTLANPIAALSLEQLSATRERPLFSPARRMPSAPTPAPPPPPVAVAPAPPPPAPSLALFGIVADEDGARALVRAGGSPEILRLRVGDTIESWTVAEIGRTEVVLRLGDRTETIGLFAVNGRKGAPAPAASARAPKVVPPPKMAVAPVLRSTPKNFESDGL
jgi:general secretion pathway protein N